MNAPCPLPPLAGGAAVAGEDDGALDAGLDQQRGEAGALGAALDQLDPLGDALDRGRLRRHLDPHRVAPRDRLRDAA